MPSMPVLIADLRRVRSGWAYGTPIQGRPDLRIITQDDGELIRELTLDPTRNYQPQAPKV
jgi:hypothetical protein